jgi:Holliday junction DNA helicase RuvA
MIAWLQGFVVDRTGDSLVLNVQGVGYDVGVSTRTLVELPPAADTPVTMHIVTVVREDALLLYGFLTAAEKRAFLLLTSVNRIGPRLALAILAELNPFELRQSILQRDTRALARVSGVGPRTAERVVLELRERIAALDPGPGPVPTTPAAAAAAPGLTPVEDLESALLNLGYGERVVQGVVRDLEPQRRQGEPLDALLRAAFLRLRAGAGSANPA